jgi:Ca2+-binding RTX toxin-like protein
MWSHSETADLFQSWTGGRDTFVFDNDFGHDTIKGFHAGSGSAHDVISLESSISTDYGHLQIQQAGHDTLIIADATNTILLTGVSASALTSMNFLFVHHDLAV